MTFPATKRAVRITKSEITLKTYEKIRVLRENKHLTQEEMALKLNMSTTGYAKIERGETRLNIPRLEQIAEIFGMDILEFMADEQKIIYQVNNDSAGNNTALTYYASIPDNQAEIDKLKLIIVHKDEIILHKEEMLEQKEKEIIMLKEMLALLKKS